RAAALLPTCEPRLEQQLVREPAPQAGDEVLPAVERQPEAELALRLARDAAALEHGARGGAQLGIAEPLLVRGRGRLERPQQRGPLPALAGTALRDRDPRAARQQLHRLEEAHLLGLLHVLERVAADLAREAVIELAFRVDRERRRFLVVERAPAHEV